jgi:hypothetical protein
MTNTSMLKRLWKLNDGDEIVAGRYRSGYRQHANFPSQSSTMEYLKGTSIKVWSLPVASCIEGSDPVHLLGNHRDSQNK